METMRTDKSVLKVKSADRVLDVLELLAETTEPLRVADIADRLETPVSSTYKLLQNLRARGYVETDKSGRLFRLGGKMLEIGSKYAQNTDLYTAFHHVAQKIVDDLNESVFMSIRNGDKVLYITEKQSNHPVRFVSHLGMQLPIHATAMGKILLSALSEDEVERLYPGRRLGRLTERTITDFDELMRQLKQARERGVAYSEGEAVPDVNCVAAPIVNALGHTIAAISISIPASRSTPELWERAERWVRQGAKEIGLKLYFHQ